MTEQAAPRRLRALIIEDEIMIALDLEDAMCRLGYDSCGLALLIDKPAILLCLTSLTSS